jgi:hypothetical protein
MGQLKQLEYGGKKLGSKRSFKDSNLLSSDPGVAKESSATTLRRRTCARERDTGVDEGDLQTMRDEATQQHPTYVYAPVHILCWKIQVGAHSAHVGGLYFTMS